jgi:hypothetical protein
MALFSGMCYPGPQYSAVTALDIVREAKCTRLGYGIRLSRLYTLDHPLALALTRSSYSATPDPE